MARRIAADGDGAGAPSVGVVGVAEGADGSTGVGCCGGAGVNAGIDGDTAGDTAGDTDGDTEGCMGAGIDGSGAPRVEGPIRPTDALRRTSSTTIRWPSAGTTRWRSTPRSTARLRASGVA
jgi:hypothetical protein